MVSFSRLIASTFAAGDMRSSSSVTSRSCDAVLASRARRVDGRRHRASDGGHL